MEKNLIQSASSTGSIPPRETPHVLRAVLLGAALLLLLPMASSAGEFFVCVSDPDCPSCPSGTECAARWTNHNGCCHHEVNDFACVSQCQNGGPNGCSMFCKTECTASGQCPTFPPWSLSTVSEVASPAAQTGCGSEATPESAVADQDVRTPQDVELSQGVGLETE